MAKLTKHDAPAIPDCAGAGAGEALAAQLAVLVEGLVFDDFGTEATDERFTVFHREAELETLTQQTVAATLGLDVEDPMEEIVRFTRELEDFYQSVIERHRVLEPAKRSQAEQLVELLQTSLRETTAVIVGRDGPGGPGPVHPLYIVGIAADGDLVGLETRVVWT